MKTTILSLAMAMALAMPALAQESLPPASEREVTVMTRNADHGVLAELQAVATATSFEDLLLKVAAVYQAYVATNFHERAAALALEIESVRPDLIGLQEAVLVRTQWPPDGPATPAPDVAFDYVEILLAALEARGLHYEVVVQSLGWDVELPSALGIDVRHTDREVILARADLQVADLKLSNAQAGNFLVNCQIPSSTLGAVTILRGWASVDAKIRGKSFRFITTHLDGDCLPFTPLFQQAQAAELLSGPAATHLPVVFVGDLNSAGDGTSMVYNSVIAAGFSDAAVVGGLGQVATCCHYDLSDASSVLDRRIDFVLFRGDFDTRKAIVVGDDPAGRTVSGRWPSDHAGVAAELVLPH
jgi:endonuclease/exonuclease/phosphatase family metal-dependent hydrolase